MAVNTAEIGLVFDALELKAKNLVDRIFDSYEITAEGRTNILSQMIVTLIQTSASITQSQPIQDAQVLQITSQVSIAQAQSAKDLLLKDAQIAQATASAASITSEKSIKEAQSAKDLLIKDAQKNMIDAQVLSETEKKNLTLRQITGYNDNLRIKEAEMLSQVTGMFGAGGTTLPAGLETTMFTAINNITV